MATRLKSCKRALAAGVLTALAVSALVVCALAARLLMPFTSDFFRSMGNSLVWMSYSLAWQADGGSIAPSQYYLGDQLLTVQPDEDSEFLCDTFDQYLYDVQASFPNLLYEVLGETGAPLLTNTSRDLAPLAGLGVQSAPESVAPMVAEYADIASGEPEQNLPSDLRFAAAVTFTKSGPELTALAAHWATERGLTDFAEWFRTSARYSVADVFDPLRMAYGEDIALRVPDVTVVFAVPTVLTGSNYDDIRDDIFEDAVTQFGLVVYLPVFLCAFALATGAALVFKKKLALGAEAAARVPSDLPLWMIAAGLLLGKWMCEGVMLVSTGYAKTDNFSGSLLPAPVVTLVCAAGGVLMWLAPLTLFFTGVLWLIYTPRKGFFRSLAARSLVAALIRRIRAAWRNLMSFDLSQPIDKMVARFVALNFILAGLFCFSWVFGFLGLVPYSIILFFALRRWARRTQNDYQIILESARRMAAGEPGARLAQSAGIFDALRVEMNAVQDGFDRAVAEEVRSQNMKTELITNVSHDLKTPLTAIITYVDLLKDDSLDEATREKYVETLDKKSQRLKRLIEDLFEMSRAASGNLKLEPHRLDLCSLMRQVLCELEDRTAACGVEFRTKYPDGKLCCLLDGQYTRRVLENLIVNITKYALAGTRAYIEAEEREGRAVLTMKNVSATELDFDPEMITERFVRGDKNRSTEGSGLGLAIARSLTELQGGTFSIETDGDLFRAVISFPLCEEPGT